MIEPSGDREASVDQTPAEGRGTSRSAPVASGRYEQEVPVVERPTIAGWMWTMLVALISGGSAGSLRQVHRVTDRLTGRVVFQVTTGQGVDHTAAVEMIARDLSTLTVAEFEREYGITA